MFHKHHHYHSKTVMNRHFYNNNYNRLSIRIYINIIITQNIIFSTIIIFQSTVDYLKDKLPKLRDAFLLFTFFVYKT